MKLVFFSDIHGNNLAFSAFLKEMEELRPDKIFFLGDIFGYYYGQKEIIDFMLYNNIHCLLGNHDKNFLELTKGNISLEKLCEKYGSSYALAVETIPSKSIEWLESLSSSFKSIFDGVSISMYHGSPKNPLNGRIYPDNNSIDLNSDNSDFIILGHTHHKMEKKIGKTSIINPGSLGQQRDGKACSYLVLDTDASEHYFRKIDYDISLLEKEIDINDPEEGINYKLKEVLRRKVD